MTRSRARREQASALGNSTPRKRKALEPSEPVDAMPDKIEQLRARVQAKAGLEKVSYGPPGRAWWPAVGAPLERRV